MENNSSTGSFNKAAKRDIALERINPKGKSLTRSGGEETKHGEGGLVTFPM